MLIVYEPVDGIAVGATAIAPDSSRRQTQPGAARFVAALRTISRGDWLIDLHRALASLSTGQRLELGVPEARNAILVLVQLVKKAKAKKWCSTPNSSARL
jgi:hypothetical protein